MDCIQVVGFKDTFNPPFLSLVLKDCYRKGFHKPQTCYPVCKTWQWVCLVVSKPLNLNPKRESWGPITLVFLCPGRKKWRAVYCPAAKVEWESSKVQTQKHKLETKHHYFLLCNTQSKLSPYLSMTVLMLPIACNYQVATSKVEKSS